MAFLRFIFFILAISIIVGIIAKYIILFLRKAKKIEEKAYDKLEKKVLPQVEEIDIQKYEKSKSQKKKK